MSGRVLIIGPEFWGYNQSVSRAFEKLNYQTEIINYKEGKFNNPDKKKWLFLKSEFEKERKVYYNNLIIEKYNEFKPDIFLVIKGTVLFKETLSLIKSAIKVLWMMDSLYRFNEVLELKESFDFLFMYEKTDVERLQTEGDISYFLPMALDETVYFPIKGKQKDIDLFFVGSLNDIRLDTLYKLMDDFKGYNLKFFGKRKFTKNRPLKYFLNKAVFPNKTLSPSEVNDYYNRSKICINLHKSQSKHGVNPRFFEIIGSKSLQIVDNNPYIKSHFDDEGIISFNGYNELRIKIQEQISNSNTISLDKVYNDVIQNHTYLNRVKRIIKILGV